MSKTTHSDVVMDLIAQHDEVARERDALLAQRDCLLNACKIALGQLEDSKPLSGVHVSSLRADIDIIKAAIALVQPQTPA